jgi:2-dehydropantoate 2-reductase
VKICVYGAGAIGGHLAARLARGGAEVSVVARGAHLAAIQANGLRVEASDGVFSHAVKASANPADLGVQDAVLVTTKTPALPDVAAGIGPLLGPDTPVVFIANGIPWWYFDRHGGALDGTRLEMLDPGDALRRAVGPARSLGGVVYSSCTVIRPGVIQIDNPGNRLIIGEIDGRISERAEAIATPLRIGGFTMTVSPDIRTDVWTKLFMNLAGSPLAVLTQAAPKSMLAEPEIEAIMRRLVAEGEAVAQALGRRCQIDAHALIDRLRPSAHFPSMLQDLQLGRPMEITTMFDATLHLARLAGAPTPTLDMIVALARVRAREAGLYG